MPRFRRSLFLASLGLAGACHDTTAPPTNPARSVSLVPRFTTLVLGGAAQLYAYVYDEKKNPVYGVPIAWHSSDPATITVSDSGLARAISQGTATISATGAGSTDTLTLHVTSTFSGLWTAGSVTCGVATTGDAFCRGIDFYGALGNSAPDANSFIPVNTDAVRYGSTLPFRVVLPGGITTCALGADSSAWCWGYAGSGDLGVGLSEGQFGKVVDLDAPTYPVTGGLRFAQIAMGGGHTCGVTATFDAYCWGDNRRGATGDQLPTSWAPSAIVGLHFTSVAAGGSTSCGVTLAGTALCWGDNSAGQLGVVTDTPFVGPAPVATGALISVSVRPTTCGLDPDGTVYCWGYNNPSPRPVPVSGGLRFVQASSALEGGCGVTVDSTGYCWDPYTLTPTSLSTPVKLSSIEAGDDWNCGVGVDSAAYCSPAECPSVDVPYCGTPPMVSRVPGNIKFRSVAAEPSFGVGCGQSVTDTLYCWGMHWPFNISPPTPPITNADLIPGSGGVQLLPLSSPLCGLAADSTALCWNVSYGGGDSVTVSGPQSSMGGRHYASFDRNGNRWCGTTGGQVYCGDSANPTPVAVPGATGFTAVGTYGLATCGLHADGSAYCWGRNSDGELGLGFASAWSATPLPVSGGHQFLSVAVGSERGCGVATDSTTWCWGGLGQADSLLFTTHLLPGGLKLGRLAVGYDFACGLTGAGAAYCWGRGLSTPTPYQPAQRFQSLSASNYYPGYAYVDVCGLTIGGDPLCWNLPSTVPAPRRLRSRLRTSSGTSFRNRP